VLLEPVTLWRSGRKSLDPVPQEDLLRLVSDFQSAVRTRLGEGFRFVEQPGPGVMRIRLAITAARASDSVLDILTASHGTDRPHPAGDGLSTPRRVGSSNRRSLRARSAMHRPMRCSPRGSMTQRPATLSAR